MGSRCRTIVSRLSLTEVTLRISAQSAYWMELGLTTRNAIEGDFVVLAKSSPIPSTVIIRGEQEVVYTELAAFNFCYILIRS
jgi:hypothetical protein